jgi:K+ transporter
MIVTTFSAGLFTLYQAPEIHGTGGAFTVFYFVVEGFFLSNLSRLCGGWFTLVLTVVFSSCFHITNRGYCGSGFRI